MRRMRRWPGVVEAAPMRAFLLNNLVLGEAPHWRMGLEEIGAAMPDLLRLEGSARAPSLIPGRPCFCAVATRIMCGLRRMR